MMRIEKYAFTMKLNPGMEAEYRRRHDEIWPELVELLKEPESRIIRSISTGKPTRSSACYGGRTTIAWPICRTSGDEALVGPHGRHHGYESRQLTSRKAAGDRLPYGLIP